jgi:hypothetical protein
LLTGGNRNDVTELMALIQDIPPVRGRRESDRFAGRGGTPHTGGGRPDPATATRVPAWPVDADVVFTGGEVVLSEGAGDEVLRGEDAAGHRPTPANWTVASRKYWCDLDRQASAGQVL